MMIEKNSMKQNALIFPGHVLTRDKIIKYLHLVLAYYCVSESMKNT